MEAKRYSHLSALEREKISIGLKGGLTLNEVARQLERSPSTITVAIDDQSGSG
jgi:IS30 family transposase